MNAQCRKRIAALADDAGGCGLSRRKIDDRLLGLRFAIIIAPGNLRSRRKLCGGVLAAASGPDANGPYLAQEPRS
jgi:hypothetical protein